MTDQRSAGSADAARKTDEMPTDEQHATDPLDIDNHQPDPMLQMSTGRLGNGGLSLVAVAIVVLIVVVLFGLNHRGTGPTARPTPIAAISGGPHG
jgi:hypothetical protein